MIHGSLPRNVHAVVALLASLVAASCGETGQSAVTLALRSQGVAPAPFVARGWTVTLTRADLAFGPAYFCATPIANADLCKVAVVDFTSSVPLDALDPSVVDVGELDGVTGTIRSAMYDLGISFFLPDSAPHPTAGAIDGHSLRIEGHAEKGAESFDFVADVDVIPTVAGRSAILAQPTTVTIATGNESLIVHLDPVAWVSPVDFDPLYAASAGGTSVVTITSDEPAYAAIVFALTVTAPPSFEWITP